MFYIFHGKDEFSRTEQLAELQSQLAGGDEAMASLNTSVIDGTKLSMSELEHNCNTMPFMADRRLIIVYGLLDRLSKGSQKKNSSDKQTFVESLVAYLPKLPPTTRLIFVESQQIRASHPVLKLANKEKTGFVEHFALPKDRDLPRWIQRQAKKLGGNLDYEAANLLGRLVGNDLRLLDQEIDKLLLYAGSRPVTSDDVKLLISRARETSIFDLVDSVGKRQPDRALQLFHRLLDDGEHALYILTMLVRQIRMLIQVSELQEQYLNHNEIASTLKIAPFVAQKVGAQARNFSLKQLEQAYQKLVATDRAIKTGEMDAILALDTLIVDLTRHQGNST